MICLFDSEVDNFGNGCENCFGTESWKEVHQLNDLQYINSKSPVFFDDTISEKYISLLSDQFSNFRESKKHINKVINHGERKFFLASSEDAHIDLDLNFYTLKVKPDNFKGQLTPLRHPSLERPTSDNSIGVI